MLRLGRRAERLRVALEQERARADASGAIADVYLRRMQDLQADIARLRESMEAVRRDADESYARTLDLEGELRHEQVRFAELQERSHEVGRHLQQALDAHSSANGVWQAELNRERAAHEQDNAAWKAELDRVHAIHEQALAAQQQQAAVWSVQLERLHEALQPRPTLLRRVLDAWQRRLMGQPAERASRDD